jgi:hypothetical protein
MNRLIRILLGVTLLAGAAGCGGSSSTPKPPDTRTPAQYFREQQSATVTPNGKIMTDTVTEQDGKIQYSTEDGKRWEVNHSKRADNTYEYGTPTELKK